MNNVKTILSALLMLASSLFSVAQEAPTVYAKALLVTTADGTQTKFALKEKPQLTIEKPYLVVNVNGTRINFELEQMVSLKYINVPVVLGDAYEDGVVNATDVTTMANYLMGKRAAGFNFSNADANNDETVNIADIVATGKHLIKSSPNSQGVSQSRSRNAAQRASSEGSGQPQYALYNYRNDGDFNAWSNKDIKHIIYSNVDIQGVEQGDIVVQEVWTSDSVYRVPLEVVDSIGFRAPAPEYQDNVFHITVQHLPYVTNVDQLSITFSSNLPANMRPQVGMVITSDTFEEPLSKGFAGKIVDINEDGSSLNVICETATVTDVFKKLILVGNAQAIDEEVAKSRPLRTTRGIFDEYEEGNQTEFEFPGKFTVKINDFISITDEVKVSADYYIYVDLPKFKVRATVTGTHDLKTSWSIDTDKILEWLGHEKEKHEPEWATPVWPIVNIPGIFNFGIRAGAFLAPSVKLSITGSTPLTFTHTFGVEFSNIDTWLIPIVTPVMNAHSELGTPDITVSLEGKLFAGIALGLKTTLIGDNVLSGDITGRFGPEFEAKIEMKQKLGEDDHFNLYSLMKDSKIGVQLKADAKVKTMVFGDNLTEKLEWDWKWPIPGWEDFRYLFPDFTKPELPFWAKPNPLSMYSTPSRNIFMPVQLGIGLFDKDGVKQKEYYCDDWYLLEKENRNIPQVYLGDVPPGTTYTCRPMFNFLGLGEIVAEPRTTFTVPNPVSMEVSSLYLNRGETKDITVSGGWGNFQLTNSNDKSVMAYFNHPDEESEGEKTRSTGDGIGGGGGGSWADDGGGESWKPSLAWNSSWPTEEIPTIHISGIDLGEATIMVRDMRSKETAFVKVVVIDENTIPLKLSLASLDLIAGKEGSVEITSGSGNYTAESSDTDVATVEVSDGIIQVTAIKAGEATITVTDTESGQTATIQVTVTATTQEGDLALSSRNLITVNVDEGRTIVVTSGSGDYAVESSKEAVATVSVRGKYVTINGKYQGRATITVTDRKSGQEVSVKVKVKKPDNSTVVSLVNNGDMEGTDVGSFFARTGTCEKDYSPADIIDGVGVDGSRGLEVDATDKVSEMWDNQFWIRFDQPISAGTNYRLSFDYRADTDANVRTETHAEPTDWIDWEYVYLDFATGWQTYTRDTYVDSEESLDDKPFQSIAFDLSGYEYANNYYFDNVKFEVYLDGQCPKPTFIVDENVISISSPFNAKIYYTLDGSTPTTSSSVYNSSIILNQSCTVKAIAVVDGYEVSPVATYSYVNDENTIPLELSLASLDLIAGKQGTVEITSGSGNYMAESSDTEVATVEVSDGIIQVTAIKAGEATITITDTESDQTATIQVTVKGGDLALSSNNLITVNVDEGRTIVITSGSGDYAVESSREAVATVSVRGKYVTINGKYQGRATITVIDRESGQEVSVKLKVKKPDNSTVVSLINNGDLEGTDVGNFFERTGTWENPIIPATITDGVGVDGSRGIEVIAGDMVSEIWDNQFWVRFDYPISDGTRYRFSYDYRADKDVSARTENHGEPGDYIYWNSFDFSSDWNTFSRESYILSSESSDSKPFRSLAFTLNEYEYANNYYFDNFIFEVYLDGQCPKPAFMIDENVISLSSPFNAKIYYTLDGSTPTTSSSVYNSSIILSQSCTVKAIAVVDGYEGSPVATYTYTE